MSQTTWLRFLENLHNLRHPARVGTWLATTARRECLRVLRRAGRELPTGESPELDGRDEAAGFEDALLEPDRKALFWQAFVGLPPRSQKLLRLLMAEPRPSYEQISRAMGMPVGSIGPTRGRCLEQLRRKVDHLHLEHGYAKGALGRGASEGRRVRASVARCVARADVSEGCPDAL